jgi:LysR family glycine cleavage system transcriptional activator
MRLPPLNAVRAFESAARHSSFRLAAAELFVTPGAVSQQIRQLEDYLGVTLFHRLPRAVRLTEAGQEFFNAATRHLKGIAQAAERVRPRPDTVTLTTVPTFASRWLMPRLPRFTQRYPKVQVGVDASSELSDLERDGFDLAVRYGSGEYPGLDKKVLFEGVVVPLCSPSYRQAVFAGGTGLDAWRQARLLHENQPDDLWPDWLAAAGLTDIDAQGGMYFSYGLLAVSAAIEGQGVALQPVEFVERELASGVLVIADQRPQHTGRRYTLVWPKQDVRPAVAQFRDWLIAEVESGSALAQLPSVGKPPLETLFAKSAP